jgi:hypothetical protein
LAHKQRQGGGYSKSMDIGDGMSYVDGQIRSRRGGVMTEGTFEKIDQSAQKMYGPKGILFCGYPAAEHQPLTDALEQIGFGDRPVIFVTGTDADKTLKEVLAYQDRAGMGQPSELVRATIMSGFTRQEVHLLMNAYRQAGLPAQLWATLTPVSEDWTVAALLKELAAEAQAFRNTQRKPESEADGGK